MINSEMQSYGLRIQELESSFLHTNQEFGIYGGRLHNLEEKISSMIIHIDQLQKNVSFLESKSEEYRLKFAYHTVRHHRQHLRIDNLIDKINKHDEIISIHSNNYAELSDRFMTSNERTTQLYSYQVDNEKIYHKHNLWLHTLQSQISDVMSKNITHINVTNNTITENIDKLLDDLKHKVNSYDKSCIELVDKISLLQKKVTSFESHQTTTDERLTLLLDQQNKIIYDKRCSDLENRIMKYEEKIDRIVDQQNVISEHRIMMREQHQQVQQAIAQIVQFDNRIISQTSRISQFEKEFKVIKDTKTQIAITKLRENFAKEESERQIIRDELQQIRKDFINIKDDITICNTNVTDCQMRYQALIKNFSKLATNIQVAEEKVDVLNKLFREIVTHSNKQSEKCTEIFKEIKDDIRMLQLKLEILTKEVDNLILKNPDFVKQILKHTSKSSK